ncbi:MAG: hypothetical protein AAF561_01905 [Planctomycetota bacterium]
MTRLLDRAVKVLERLPEDRQDAFAQRLLDELESEADEKWDARFAATQDELSRVADDVMEEYRQGATEEKGWGEA